MPSTLAPVEQDAPAVAACPKCEKPLVDPNGLGWCSACGYCRSLEVGNAAISQAEAAVRRPSFGGMSETGDAIRGLPMWFWTSLLMVALGLFVSILANRQLPLGDCLERAKWATLQIAVGAFLIFSAQARILINIAHEEPSLNWLAALMPGRIWVCAYKRLPRFQESVWAASLGIAFVLGGFVFIGGLQHWFSYIPRADGTSATPTRSGTPKKLEYYVVPD